MKRATLRDVAQASGVSATTVSFVLNDTVGQTIPQATREKVKAAVAELGYTPHGIARALREGHSRVVLLHLGDLLNGDGLQNFIRGMDEELSLAGHTLVVRFGRAGDAAGLELVKALAPAAELDVAVLYAGEGSDADGGWVDGLAAHTFTQLEHLVSRGHRHIALALPEAQIDSNLVRIRMSYVRESARRLGISEPPTLIVAEDATSVLSALTHLRLAHPHVTAVAGYTDEIAMRVLTAMAQLELSAPGDLAVIGFDDSRYAAFWTPALTTVRINALAFGHRAARRALGMAVESAEPLKAQIIVRATT